MQKNTFRDGRVNTVIHETIASFLQEIANTNPLITVSYVHLSRSGTTARVYCSIFPKEQTENALSFLQRKEKECKKYIKKHTSLRIIPTIRFIPAKKTLPDPQQ